MQEKRYSEMTDFELTQEIAILKEKARKAEQLGMINELYVLERKVLMAKAYLLDVNDFQPGEVYEVEDDKDGRFQIAYLNGVFAWGNRLNCQETEAFPISMLHKVSKGED